MQRALLHACIAAAELVPPLCCCCVLVGPNRRTCCMHAATPAAATAPPSSSPLPLLLLIVLLLLLSPGRHRTTAALTTATQLHQDAGHKTALRVALAGGGRGYYQLLRLLVAAGAAALDLLSLLPARAQSEAARFAGLSPSGHPSLVKMDVLVLLLRLPPDLRAVGVVVYLARALLEGAKPSAGRANARRSAYNATTWQVHCCNMSVSPCHATEELAAAVCTTIPKRIKEGEAEPLLRQLLEEQQQHQQQPERHAQLQAWIAAAREALLQARHCACFTVAAAAARPPSERSIAQAAALCCAAIHSALCWC